MAFYFGFRKEYRIENICIYRGRVKYDIETALLSTLVSMFNTLFHAQFSSAANHVRELKRFAVKRLFGISILNSVDGQDKFRVQS